MVALPFLGGTTMTDLSSGDPSAERKENKKSKTPKATVAIEVLLQELEQSGRKLIKSSKGHRALLRDTLETAQRIIVKFLDNDALLKQFVHAVKKEKKKGRKKSGPFNWCLEVVAKATGASSRTTRQLASKRAGVLEFLRERNVPVRDTAVTLKKEGLENLYSEWCKKKKETPTAASPPPSGPDGKVMFPLWMERSVRDQLLNQKVGVKLTVLVSRTSESDGDFQVKGVTMADCLGEDADDWEE